jgi:hypothetical protein
LTVPTSGLTPGTYTLTVTGTSGSGLSALTRTTDVTLDVTAPPSPDFSLAIAPSSQSIVQGATTSVDYVVTVTAVNGYVGSPTLTYDAVLPSGTVSGPVSNGSGGWQWTLTLNTASLSANTYAIPVTATDGSLSHSTSATLTVTPQTTADFSISASPGARNVRAGQNTSYTVTISGTGGFTGAVTFSLVGLPGGASFSFSPSTVAGSGSTTLQISTGSASGGTYTLTIKGTSGTTTHSTTVSLRIR